MLKLIGNLLALNAALAGKVRSVQAYDEALSLHVAGEFKLAYPLMREAAELGNENAMGLLGSMYLLGQGIKEDGVQAERWLTKSIEGGYEDAISVLGMAYATGKAGVKIDFDKAIPMLTQASDRGDERAARMLSMIENGEGMFKRLKKGKRKAT
jgi:TPR repeat protein